MFFIILSYLVIYIVWGTTYFFIKEAIETIPPFWLISLRFVIGGFFLFLFSIFSKRLKKLPSKNEILSAMFIGTLLFLGGNGLITIAEEHVDSYLAALIASCIPIFVLIMDRIILKVFVSRSAWAGVFLGISGVAILLTNGTDQVTSFSVYILLVLLGVFCFSLGTSLSKLLPMPNDIFVSSAIQLSTVGLISLFIVQFTIPVTTMNWSNVTPQSWFALGYLTILGTIAIACFVYLLKNEPNHRLVTYTFVNPLIAIYFGIMIGGEKAVTGIIPGTLLIISGLIMMFYGAMIFKKLKTYLDTK